MSPPKALVLTGFGLNCDGETAFALETAGADPERIHLNTSDRRCTGTFAIFRSSSSAAAFPGEMITVPE